MSSRPRRSCVVAAESKTKKRSRDEDDEGEASAGGDDSDASVPEGESDGDDEDDDMEFDESDEDVKPKRKAPAKKASPKKKATPTKKKATPTKKTPPKKKASPKKASPAAKKKAPAKKPAAKTTKKATPSKTAGPKKVKQLKPLEELDMAMKGFKWWDAEVMAKGVRWKHLEHKGVVFAPEYEPHGVKMLYDGKPVELSPIEEELATMYATIKVDGPQLGDPKIAPVFNANFFKDFKSVLSKDHGIKDFKKCDFSDIREHLERKSEARKERTKEEKEAAKAEKDEQTQQHGYAILDKNRIERLSNYMTEPPGLFRGRGAHPKRGVLKQRVLPEEVTINCSVDATVPACPMPGHNWKKVVHEPTKSWLAYWKDNVMGSFKYVFLAASSSLKGKSDRAKYEKARRLCLHIDTIRRTYEKNLKSSDVMERQLATAIWVIDRLSLRAGNEKDETEADTFGCCSLRVEHVKFPETAKTSIELDFLGKDSMRYNQIIELVNTYGKTGKKVFKNIKAFCKDKAPGADVFDQINSSSLNKALSNMMPGLSAKVFRTYNASITLEKELEKSVEEMDGLTPNQKQVEYNRANREVAILCNHQRTVPKGFAAQFEKMTLKQDLFERQIAELEKFIKLKKKGKDVPLKTADADKETKAQETHLFARQPSVDQLEKKLDTFRKNLAKHKLNMKNKDDNKEVALGTSKINYMDPRISVAWCKRIECPIEKVFARTLRDKFPWAMSVKESWRFEISSMTDLEPEDENDEDSDGGDEFVTGDDPDEAPKSKKAKKKPASRKSRAGAGAGAGAAADDSDDDDDDMFDDE